MPAKNGHFFMPSIFNTKITLLAAKCAIQGESPRLHDILSRRIMGMKKRSQYRLSLSCQNSLLIPIAKQAILPAYLKVALAT